MGRAPRRLAIALVLALAACTRGGADRRDPAERVVCVSKQINEFMYDIGAQGVLVARDLTSIYPPAIRSLPSVGYHRALSAEGIISTRPTLFLTDGNVGPDAVLDQLRTVGIPILILRPGGTVDSAQLLMRRLGERFHREHAADSVLAAWRQGMRDVWADSARWAGQRRPRVLIMHFGQIVNDYLAVNRGGPADEMLRWAGGENAVDSIGGMTRLTPELIAKAAPDVIIATDVGFDRVGSAERFAELPGVALTPAGKSGRIYRVDETQIMYFGPRTPASVRALAAMIHR
ncbi:MAG TPA: ABC transporter substrate-binding protein [Gemmatimonadaceae bacterium]|nr:ABC transporter substrate-binding protein [Gemmatimonadaceae bacterium]